MSHKILVIDDDFRIHSLIKSQFDDQRFEIASSYNGTAGIEAAARCKPDVILLDVDLPPTQGFEVCRQLKLDRETKGIPVIFITSSSTVESKIFGLECGANDYLTKPFHPHELQARVRVALRTRAEIEGSTERGLHDPVTLLPDRKYFEMRLDADLALAGRSGRPLGCILLDIDGMELVNTWFGMQAGDELLKQVGEAIQGVCRREDVVCRFEDDTYAALISNATLEHLGALAARARIAVRGVTSMCGSDSAFQVTASAGFALSRFSSGSSIVDEAHEAMMRAKAAGGDCVRAGKELAELRLAV